jgi:hypothetical protein
MTLTKATTFCRRVLVIFPAFLMVLLAGSNAQASGLETDIAAGSQPSAECHLPVKSPPAHGADNTANCRSTQAMILTYFTNFSDTSGCTFDLTIAWGDGETTHRPNYPGGPQGLEFLASHTYSAAGVYTIAVTGSVTSGNCYFTPGDWQFSYISPATAYPAGPPISVQTMLSRAADWISAQVPYSQVDYYSDLYGTYRQDCSGFVSMAWDLDYSLTTSSLPTVATEVTTGLSGIAPGDIILKAGDHVFLFVEWANSAHTRATVDEETGSNSPTPYAVMKTLGVSSFNGFTVYQYNELSSSKEHSGPAARNWTGSYSGGPDSGRILGSAAHS